MMPCPVSSVETFAFASPKSMSFKAPLSDTMTFDGVMSRWMMPSGAPFSSVRLCAWSSASHSWATRFTVISCGTEPTVEPQCLTSSLSVGPLTYSIAMK